MRSITLITFSLFCSLIIGVSCNKKLSANDKITEKDSCNTNIEYISALYYNYTFNSARARNWDDLILNIPNFINKSNGVLNATITNCNLLKEIETQLKTLKPMDEQRSDADIRIVIHIKYKNKEDLTLCIGGYFSDGLFTKDRIALKSQSKNKLLYLIKNNIGYYPWFSEEDLENMDELKDTTFVREARIESPYYKKYLEMQRNRK